LRLQGYVDNAQQSLHYTTTKHTTEAATCFTFAISLYSLLATNNAHRSLIEATVPGGMLWFAVAMDCAYSLLAWKHKRSE
jgi:hypothetical protein